jgi:hypothetical protein
MQQIEFRLELKKIVPIQTSAKNSQPILEAIILLFQKINKIMDFANNEKK